MSKNIITLEGKLKLEEEIHRLLTVERPAVIRAIEEARAQGDISENAEYEAAKERQAMIEARISQLQGLLSNLEVVDPKSLRSDKILFGATVYLTDLESDDEVCYQLVSSFESDIQSRKISIQSPLGRALIGKKKNETVTFETPKGSREYLIKDFEYK